MIVKAQLLAQGAQKFKDPEGFLIRLMGTAQDPHTLAQRLLGYICLVGSFPDMPATPIWSKAEAIVRAYMGQRRVFDPATKSFDGATADYEIVPASDEARSQWKEWREKHGLTHVGTRHVFPKPRCHRHDTRYLDWARQG